NKLNIAIIGVSGRGGMNLKEMVKENIVALCDVDANNLARAGRSFPKAKKYKDWRKCLEQKDIDAVVCSTTDHTHAFIATWAMNRDKSVYCEKPLATTVEEAHMVRQTYLKKKGKIATQMGTQVHATENPRRFVELIRDGAIGTPKTVKAWCDRKPKCEAYHPGVRPIPNHIDWDLWIGPSQFHPYNPKYLGGCLQWNRFWDFGAGQIGDMGSHVMDLASWGFDLMLPTSCQAKGTPNHPDGCPEQLKAEWEHPANDWRPAVKSYWYDGGLKPGMPSEKWNRDRMDMGILFTGDKGWLLADYTFRGMMLKGDMTHYKSPTAKTLIPESIGHHAEWIKGCKEGTPTLCNFDYSGALIESNMLATVASRVGKKLEYDAKNMKVTNCPEAEQYLRKTYRKGWVLNG
ncbi:MAG: Gfo/Idh/MocA family oxidoreductase, partial [Desulfobulbaceae bacterium]|nr:Gfo/Idh/MocA family oxidoreductase [Desulfobulbaceae bacterium]